MGFSLSMIDGWVGNQPRGAKEQEEMFGNLLT